MICFITCWTSIVCFNEKSEHLEQGLEFFPFLSGISCSCVVFLFYLDFMFPCGEKDSPQYLIDEGGCWMY